MKYLVIGSDGPGFVSPEEAFQILEKTILPSLEYLMKLEAQNKILTGGVPIGDRAFVFIVESSSNEELDQLLRNIPVWGSMQWEVTPLHAFSGRAAQERDALKKLKIAKK
jgi:muconolactone delta-isomerase